MNNKVIYDRGWTDSNGNKHEGDALLKGVEYVRDYYVKINNECIENALDGTTRINTDSISIKDYVLDLFDENIRGLNGEYDFKSVSFVQQLNFYFTGDYTAILK